MGSKLKAESHEHYPMQYGCSMLLMLLMPVVTSNYLIEDLATIGAVGIATGDMQVNLLTRPLAVISHMTPAGSFRCYGWLSWFCFHGNCCYC